MLRTYVFALLLPLTVAVASAGTYSGPTETSHPIDAAIPSNSPLFTEWADQIDASRTFFAPRGSTTISPTGVNSLGDLDATQISAGDPVGYENGFAYGSPNGLFAELAYVEVSSNGVDFARFPSISTNVAPVTGSGAFAGFDMSNVYNLAGKHAGGFGTPFNLDDLLTDPLVAGGSVDLTNIQFVKLVDIPGNGSYLDSQGNPILDNWLTTGSGGFDFRLPVGQGVGVLHAVPEPASLALAGVAALLAWRRRR